MGAKHYKPGEICSDHGAPQRPATYECGCLVAAHFATLSAARAEALEAAAWWRLCVEQSEWFRDEGRTHLAVRVPDGADLSCQAMRENAMRAAICAMAQNARG